MNVNSLVTTMEHQVKWLDEIKEFVQEYGDEMSGSEKGSVTAYIDSIEEPWKAILNTCKMIAAREKAEKNAVKETEKVKQSKPVKPQKPKKEVKKVEAAKEEEDWDFLGEFEE